MITHVLLAHNRPRLTEQALRSLAQNASGGDWRACIVDDGSSPQTAAICRSWVDSVRLQGILVRNAVAVGPGNARNTGIEAAAEKWGRQGLLHLCDNDAFFMPGWDRQLVEAFHEARERHDFRVVGGYCHPFQRPVREFPMRHGTVLETQALGLLSWLWEWESWDKWGPFDGTAQINGSEDWACCQRIRSNGFRVGVVSPAVVVNCGVTSSGGKPCPGAQHLWEQTIPEGVVIE